MATTVQTRLDAESREALDTLTRRLGMTRSEVVRESLRQMLRQQPPVRSRELIGAGQFDSGVGDLATNKKHMEGFGLTRHQRLEVAKSRESK